MTLFDIQIFGFQLSPTYYGLMYVLGFVFGYILLRKRGFLGEKQLEDLLFFVFLGVILGGRLGYIVFYNFSSVSADFWSIFRIWEGGMSFHGGLLGVIVALIFFAWKYKIRFYTLADEVALVVPIGIGLGRIGNYLNKELLGFAEYDGWLAVYVGSIGYFPSPLLEALLEGGILFTILYFVYIKKQFEGQIACLFLILYSCFRIFVELFFRMPDVHIGYIWGNISLGVLLTIPMLFLGVYFYYTQKK